MNLIDYFITDALFEVQLFYLLLVLDGVRRVAT